SLPVPGWDDTYQWQGYIPYDELPVVLNPHRGYLVNANNAVMPDGEQLFTEHLYASAFRAIRAEELVTAAMADGNFTVDEHIAIQIDTKNLFASMILSYVLALDESTIRENVERESRLLAPEVDTDEEEEELAEKIEERIEGALAAVEMLSDWDLMMDVDSIGATVFSQFYVDLCYKTYGDQIPEAVWDGSWGTTSGVRLRNSLLWPLAEEPNNAWWDDTRTLDVTESRDDIMARALSSAYETLVEDLGDNTNKWEWGEVHTIEYRNATLGESGIGFVENIFNRGPEPVSGGMSVLRRADFKVREPFGVYHIASMRMIADLSDWSSTLWVHSPGQSGHPASKHYNDAMDEWIDGEYFTHPWTLEDIRDQAQQSLMLEPME
ncbi:MAG: penicillin acylase family protein, partial [Spirochaetaceae bacterium]|nr:penicillin acylase family protein [Spirochaetaceae bacterium]